LKTEKHYSPLNILLADDDTDDCIFFKEAVQELGVPVNLTIVNEGEQLMKLLSNVSTELPHALFLDLNMPRKNGFECLSEIKDNIKLSRVPVIMFSTSFEQDVVNLLYKNGAHRFIRKPPDFTQFKKIIQQVLASIIKHEVSLPAMENFVLTAETNDRANP
jgi:CheY-like chemotaxis protein